MRESALITQKPILNASVAFGFIKSCQNFHTKYFAKSLESAIESTHTKIQKLKSASFANPANAQILPNALKSRQSREIHKFIKY